MQTDTYYDRLSLTTFYFPDTNEQLNFQNGNDDINKDETSFSQIDQFLNLDYDFVPQKIFDEKISKINEEKENIVNFNDHNLHSTIPHRISKDMGGVVQQEEKREIPQKHQNILKKSGKEIDQTEQRIAHIQKKKIDRLKFKQEKKIRRFRKLILNAKNETIQNLQKHNKQLNAITNRHLETISNLNQNFQELAKSNTAILNQNEQLSSEISHMKENTIKSEIDQKKHYQKQFDDQTKYYEDQMTKMNTRFTQHWESLNQENFLLKQSLANRRVQKQQVSQGQISAPIDLQNK